MPEESRVVYDSQQQDRNKLSSNKLQIQSPDEFDMMLKLQAPSRLNMKELDDGLFYRIDLARSTRSPIQAFLLENERTLSSSKILSETYRLVCKFIKNYKVPDEGYRWEVNRKRPHSPAVTLLISVDLVPALEWISLGAGLTKPDL
ncbi:cyclic GMP-AMP synthase [Cottoperca gobio]|uniref:Cyclic GMP-AMP synthase n=1 Tax=Cottoperca gobio TaxID=56716 RepID=A0A6J2QQH3_COTGO|nr:cyclic GMP-AMP synthase-like [Cottoperca gobio]